MADNLNLSNSYSGLIGQFSPGNSPYGSPLGPGLMDVYDYEVRKNQQDQAKSLALNQAKQLADTNSQMIKEYMAGAPGREAMTGLGNEVAQTAAKNPALFAQGKLMEQISKNQEFAEKFRKGFNAEADEASMAVGMAQQKSPEAALQEVRNIKQINPNMNFAGGKIKDIPDEQLMALFGTRFTQVMMDRKTSTTGGAIAVQNLKSDTAKKVAEIGANSRVKVAEIAAAAKKAAAAAILEAKKAGANPKTIEAVIAQRYQAAITAAVEEEDYSTAAELQAQATKDLKEIRAAPQVQGAAEKAEQGRQTVEEIKGPKSMTIGGKTFTITRNPKGK